LFCFARKLLVIPIVILLPLTSTHAALPQAMVIFS